MAIEWTTKSDHSSFSIPFYATGHWWFIAAMLDGYCGTSTNGEIACGKMVLYYRQTNSIYVHFLFLFAKDVWLLFSSLFTLQVHIPMLSISFMFKWDGCMKLIHLSRLIQFYCTRLIPSCAHTKISKKEKQKYIA